MPSPRKTVAVKRGLRSPLQYQPSSKQRNGVENFPTVSDLVVIKKVCIPLQTQHEQHRFLLPKTVVTTSADQTAVLDKLTPGMSRTSQKSARKSLEFSDKGDKDKENTFFPPIDSTLHGEVEVKVYHPSGVKSTFVQSEVHKKICKAIFRKTKTNKVIVDYLCKSDIDIVTSEITDYVKLECEKLCKRGSDSIFQKKGYKDFFDFSWERVYLELKDKCPVLLSVISAAVGNIPPSVPNKPFRHILLSTAIALHGRSQEMSLIQYITGFLMLHGGCTQLDIERLAQIGLVVHPVTTHRKLESWKNELDTELLKLRDSWAVGGTKKYQLIGDNWDKNILPSYRTSDKKTQSLHLFNMYAIVDRVTPVVQDRSSDVSSAIEFSPSNFIPSLTEQRQLMKELTFVFATSVISNISQLNNDFKDIYPVHLDHCWSQYCGNKTTQYPLGLFDCNENKTNELIQLLIDLSNKYVPCREGEVVEPVFFGGDRLTDERVQSAQKAMSNAETAKERLEGFVSKIEDFHRLMNFLEAIHKLTYDTGSAKDRGTAYYYRNLLNLRNVKADVKNAYRPYKLLYYTLLDAICVVLFLDYFQIGEVAEDKIEIPYPRTFEGMTKEEKIQWINDICECILAQWFFEGESMDLFAQLREVLEDPSHPENYWVSNYEPEDGRFKCHFCEKTYAFVASLQSHEMKQHNVSVMKTTKQKPDKEKDQLQDHIIMLFRLVILHKNFDTAVDMGDGNRSVCSAKYELPIYNKTNKLKYVIGSIHLTAMASGETLTEEQKIRLRANRFVNVQGGRNNNLALDEYLEMLNRDSKVACSGHNTKESIINHSKGYPHIINITKHFDTVCEIRKRKGFHHLPSYPEDVHKVVKDLLQLDVLTYTPERTLSSKRLSVSRNPFDDCFVGLSKLIYRHKPTKPYQRLRDRQF